MLQFGHFTRQLIESLLDDLLNGVQSCKKQCAMIFVLLPLMVPTHGC